MVGFHGSMDGSAPRHRRQPVLSAGVLALVGLLALGVERSSAQAPAFRVHPVDAGNEATAAAAFDVNQDGHIDIIAGGFWYAGPDWTRHFQRDVERIRGRLDDYSNLPLDVNGDGRLDLVSANYRSRSLYWVEHPGDALGQPWPRHVIDQPGPMETGRLVDIDGDGRWDILPNGLQFAAWWELLPGSPPRWQRHDLPDELAAHGVGAGDVNGDGRVDLVSFKGWLEGPEDPRAGRWIWHPEFRLDRDGSIPILVWDVDQDGDGDLVWARGHNIGVFWTEQVREGDRRGWIRHTIDTSISQAHSLLRADLDGDGRDELIAGKRYLGHGGSDPGEYDPLRIYWYRFEPASRTWIRGVVSDRDGVGFGLDPKAVDLDGDGDLDVLAADRSGLAWCENLSAGSAGDAVASSESPLDWSIQHHQQPLVLHTDAGRRTIEEPLDWGRRRELILQGMQAAMGRLPGPERRVPLDIELTEVVPTPHGYERHRVSYRSEPGSRVPAYLLIPDRAVGGKRRPAVICLHQTTSIGKDEPTGLGGNADLHYAHELAVRGFVCLVPDYPSFGDHDYDFDQSPHASGTMKAIWDVHRGVDLLQSLDFVDGDRIGCIGHSLGGHHGLYSAAFDQRIQAMVTSCGFTAFHHYYEGNLAGWTSDRYMPRIREQFALDPDRMPFDFHEVLAAIAPRPLFIAAPLHDGNFEVRGVEEVVAAAAPAYRLRNREDLLHVVYPDCGHAFPEEIREQAYDWLERHLER